MSNQPDQEVVLREDLNVGQLGLISIQRKIAPDYTSWQVAFERAGISSEIECNGAQKYGVPHGIDNDSYRPCRSCTSNRGALRTGASASRCTGCCRCAGWTTAAPTAA